MFYTFYYASLILMLLIFTGHVADSLQTSDPDVFLTSDGGYSWIKVS